MSITKIRWTMNRLRAMDAPEITHRVREKIRRQTAKRAAPSSRFEIGCGPLPKLPGIDIPYGFDASKLRRSWRLLANAARAGQYHFLGTTWPSLTNAEKWHIDPETGKTWPRGVYCFDVAYRHNKDLGDIKYVWELNRLQFLQPIAALGAIEKDECLIRYCVAEIENWIDMNPPFKGVNWCSGIELALRIISICTIVSFIGQNAFSNVQTRKLRMTLNAHGYWLERYPSRFSSANNHLIAEAVGLFLLGTLAPDFPNAGRYEAYGRKTLIEEVKKQILDDGVGAEQSPTYTAFTIELLLLVIHVSREVGNPFPSDVTDRLALAGRYLRWLTDERGNLPHIGDDDEGRVFYSQLEAEPHYVASIVGCLASMLERSNLAPPCSDDHLRNLVFGFSSSSKDHLEGVKSFKAGGYTVVRETISDQRVLFVMDHGPLGYLAIAAHGHADALALMLHVNDRPVLIDAGTYRYHSGGVWRNYFRGTKAHNTLNINGEDQSIISGPFNWSHKANTELIHVEETPGAWRIVAEHDGYLGRFGVVHKRELMRGDNASVFCVDSFSGRAKFDDMYAEIRYLLAPELTVKRTDENAVKICIGNKNVCKLSFFLNNGDKYSPISLFSETADISTRFAQKETTTALCCRLPAADLFGNQITTEFSFL